MSYTLALTVLRNHNTWAVLRLMLSNIAEFSFLQQQSERDKSKYAGRTDSSLSEGLVSLVVKGKVLAYLAFAASSYNFYHLHTLWHSWNEQSAMLKKDGSFSSRLWSLFTDPSSQEWSAIEIAAMTFAMCGSAIRIWSQITLCHQFTYELTILEDHKLVTHGPYAWLRHPSYFGGIGIFFGDAIIPAILHRWPLLGAWNIFLLGSILSRIPSEDAVLSEHFGEECAEWHRRTWRVVPFVW